jgi:AcrR family transcriptional regulator
MTAAAELFAERGVDVPLEEIAKRAGVSIGTLYNHFPNRGALLDAALPDWAGELDQLAEAARSRAHPSARWTSPRNADAPGESWSRS